MNIDIYALVLNIWRCCIGGGTMVTGLAVALNGLLKKHVKHSLLLRTNQLLMTFTKYISKTVERKNHPGRCAAKFVNVMVYSSIIWELGLI